MGFFNACCKRKKILPFFIIIPSVLFLFLYSEHSFATPPKKDPGKSEMMAKPGEDKAMAPKASSEMKGKMEDKKDASEPALGKEDVAAIAAAEHKSLFIESQYPSATTCATCHPKHCKQWSKSQHAYAQVSPVYLSFSSFTNEITSGTNGDFCFRCHSPVGANMKENPFMSNLDRHPSSR